MSSWSPTFSNFTPTTATRLAHKKTPLSENSIRSIVTQIARGLRYLHSRGFIHRDIKPENILISQNGTVKLADFGFAKLRNDLPPFTPYISTRWYRAPEILLRFPRYDASVDIFALGCVMAELYRLSPLFDGENEVEHLMKIVGVLGTPPNIWIEGFRCASNLNLIFPRLPKQNLKWYLPNASDLAIDLLDRMLNFIPENRITADEILIHYYCAQPEEPPKYSGRSRGPGVSTEKKVKSILKNPSGPLTSQLHSFVPRYARAEPNLCRGPPIFHQHSRHPHHAHIIKKRRKDQRRWASTHPRETRSFDRGQNQGWSLPDQKYLQTASGYQPQRPLRHQHLQGGADQQLQGGDEGAAVGTEDLRGGRESGTDDPRGGPGLLWNGSGLGFPKLK